MLFAEADNKMLEDVNLNTLKRQLDAFARYNMGKMLLLYFERV